ncbi:MAG: hypothetical protein EAZ95_11105 [Bacteroidetes bacterium]|nr:MAG: hypothetical protein EAZ95_11105 [Bacteroidota bacterium]
MYVKKTPIFACLQKDAPSKCALKFSLYLNVFDMTKREIELLLFYQETEARNLKFFVKKAYEESNQQEIDYFLDKLKAIMDKIEQYKKLLEE